MKKLIFLFALGMILLAGVGSAGWTDFEISTQLNSPTSLQSFLQNVTFNWTSFIKVNNATTLYDNFDDGSINTGKWYTTTAGSYAGTTESDGKITSSVWGGGSATYLYSNASLPALENISSIRFKSTFSVGSSTHKGPISISFGGQQIIYIDTITSEETHEYQLLRINSTTFNVTKDGVFEKIIIPTTNVLMMTAGSGLSGSNTASISMDYVYYRQNPLLSFMNTTILVWNSSNDIINQTYLTISGNYFNNSFLEIENLNRGEYKWNSELCVVDILGISECNITNSNITFTVGFATNSITYNSTTYETASETFILNTTLASGITSSSATFYYNGTNKGTATKTSDGTNTIFTSTIEIPASTGSKDFYWTLNLDGELFNTTTSSQTVQSPTVISVTTTTCGAGLTPAFYFDFKDETETTKVLNATINYNIRYGYSNTSGFVTYGNITTPVYNFTVCINQTQPFYYIDYGEIQYQSEDYRLRRFYIFENTRATNITISNTLYLIPIDVSTEYSFIVQDNLYKAQTEKYTTLLRWYPELDEYKVVEMGRTDSEGKTVNYVITGSADYRFGVYERDGTLIYLTDPSRYVCSVLPCVSTITIPASPLSFTNLYNIQSLLYFNSTSKIFYFVWNDKTQSTELMNLTVYKENYGTSIIVCSTSSNEFTGLLLCDVSEHTGNLRAVVYRTASPITEFVGLIVRIGGQLSEVAGGKTIGLFMGAILLIFAFLAGIYHPVAAIVLGFAALIPPLYFGSISRLLLIGVILLGALVIHFMRRV